MWISSETAANILSMFLDGSEANEKFLATIFKTTPEQLQSVEGKLTSTKVLRITPQLAFNTPIHIQKEVN